MKDFLSLPSLWGTPPCLLQCMKLETAIQEWVCLVNPAQGRGWTNEGLRVCLHIIKAQRKTRGHLRTHSLF